MISSSYPLATPEGASLIKRGMMLKTLSPYIIVREVFHLTLYSKEPKTTTQTEDFLSFLTIVWSNSRLLRKDVITPLPTSIKRPRTVPDADPVLTRAP